MQILGYYWQKIKYLLLNICSNTVSDVANFRKKIPRSLRGDWNKLPFSEEYIPLVKSRRRRRKRKKKKKDEEK